jgi:hypothetical protein
MSPAATARPFWKLIDWRLVAAVGLPIWAFVIGMLVTWKPAAHGSPPPALAVTAGPTELPQTVELAPAPREVVVRSEIVPLPIVVPVLPAEPVEVAEGTPAAPTEPEFTLPPSEFIPADRCQTFDTKVRFHAGLPEAVAEANTSKKMLFVLHISGNFDDPGFT